MRQKREGPWWAKRALGWLTQNAVINLLVLAWLVVQSIYGFYSSCRQTRLADEQRRLAEEQHHLEEHRLGFVGEPETEFTWTGTSCVLLNRDRRDIAEATLIFNRYLIDATTCTPGGTIGQSHANPVAAAPNLQPRGRLEVRFTPRELEDTCQALHQLGCPADHDCRVMVECEAQFHRKADLEPFHRVMRALSSKDCATLRSLNTLYTAGANDNGVERISWKDPADERAHQCYEKSRQSFLTLQQEAKTSWERIDRLAERRQLR